MRFRSAFRTVSVAAALTLPFAVSSCKDQPAPATNSPALPGGGGSTAAFDKPLVPTGAVKIQLLTNGTSPFWDALGKAVDSEKKNVEGTVDWRAPEPADNNTQRQLFESSLAANVNGIGVSPIEADAFASVIDAAIEKGVPVITFDSDSAKSKRLVYIGTNNYEAGKRAGESAVKMLPGGGSYVAFVGNMSAQNARDRYRGFQDAVKDHKFTELQPPFEDNKDVGRARQNVAEAVTKFGDKINLLVGLYSYNGPAIVDEAVKSNIRAKTKIVCFDVEPKTRENLEKGLVDVTIVQKPYEFGRVSTKLLYLINRKGFKAAMDELKPELETQGMKVEGANIDTGVDVVTPDNAAPFLQRMREMGLTST